MFSFIPPYILDIILRANNRCVADSECFNLESNYSMKNKNYGFVTLF